MYASLGSENVQQARLHGGTPRPGSGPCCTLRPGPLPSAIGDCLCPGCSRFRATPPGRPGAWPIFGRPSTTIFPWEEVADHALHSLLHHGRLNLLVPLPSLWHGQVGVEISDHQQRVLPGMLDDGHDDALYLQVVFWGQVAPHYKLLMVA